MLRPRAFLDWPENQTLDCASIPPLAGFRRLGDPTDLRLTTRSRVSGPACVASIRCHS
jgi:hypothetical protein